MKTKYELRIGVRIGDFYEKQDQWLFWDWISLRFRKFVKVPFSPQDAQKVRFEGFPFNTRDAEWDVALGHFVLPVVWHTNAVKASKYSMEVEKVKKRFMEEGWELVRDE